MLFMTAAGLLGGITLQLPFVKAMIAEYAEETISEQIEGDISIGELNGFLPFTIRLNDLSVTHTQVLEDTTAQNSVADTILVAPKTSLIIDYWQLMKNQLRIESLVLNRPEIRLKPHTQYLTNLEAAIRPSDSYRKTNVSDTNRKDSEDVGMNLYAPNIQILNGMVAFSSFDENPVFSRSGVPQVSNLNLDMFAEWTSEFQFFDVNELNADIEDFFTTNLSLEGQVYRDSTTFEFNRLSFETDKNSLYGDVIFRDKQDLSGTGGGPEFEILLDSSRFVLSELASLHKNIPDFSEPVFISGQTNGTLNEIQFDSFEWYVLNSGGEVTGSLKNATTPDELTYRFELKDMVVELADLQELGITLPKQNESAVLNHLTTDGALYGSLGEINADILTVYQSQAMGLQLSYNRSTKDYRIRTRFNSFNLDTLQLGIPVRSVTGDLRMKGNGLTYETITANLEGTLFDLQLANGETVDEIRLETELQNRYIQPEFTVRQSNMTVQGSGFWDGREQDTEGELDITFTNFNLMSLPGGADLPLTDLDGTLRLQADGSNIENLSGSVTLDILDAVVNSDSVKSHQLYADITRSRNGGSDQIRLTSTALDANLNGKFDPEYWIDFWNYWKVDFQKSYLEAVNADTSLIVGADEQIANLPASNTAVTATIKDLSIIKSYLPIFDGLELVANIDLNMQASEKNLVLVGGVEASKGSYNQDEFRNLSSKITYSLQKDNESIKPSWVINSSIDSVSYQGYQLVDVLVEHDFASDTAGITIRGQGADRVNRMEVIGKAVQSPDSIAITFSRIYAGQSDYWWLNNGEVEMKLMNDERLMVERFEMMNQSQKIRLDGVLSSQAKDTMSYKVENLNLKRLSELFKLETQYDGVLDADFSSRTLTRVPDIEGNIDISGFSLDDKLLGDIGVESIYNRDADQFDLRIEGRLDSLNYPRYYAENNKVGTDILIEGYLKNPQNFADSDTLYYADIDINSLDLWLLNYFIPDIFTKVDGRAVAEGVFLGNMESYDFFTSFKLSDVLVTPVFLNTDYRLNGDIDFGFDEGVIFKKIAVTDTRGGSGVIDGLIDLNQFEPIKPFDLSLRLNNLRFLKNDFAPDAPFYGDVAGTGVVRLGGDSENPYLETPQTIVTTSDSRLSVPLLDQQNVDQQRKFIEFVDSFNLAEIKRNNGQKKETEQSSTEDENGDDETFTELFQLNLQFKATPGTTFELVFDPVTNEVLTADGSGDLNITLGDEELRMFGQFDVNGGEYMFVGGDILSKRFNLSDGGTIAWEGNPQNPRINLTATYRTRPNFEPITGNDVRVPVILVLKLSGSINSLQNDFYFDIPSGTYQNTESASSVQFLLNSEDQKLAQATSLLLTNSFFPINTGQGTNSGLTNNLQNNATQVGISQLLSNQINNLLNSSISNLDVDLNLNGFDQADLGIALRLFNDRLVLRREGQLTGSPAGSQNFVGDLGASYRLSRALSLEVFYRQDPSVSNYGALQDQVQNVGGVGLQYQVEFNAWQQLPSKVWNNILSLFGLKEDEPATTQQR